MCRVAQTLKRDGVCAASLPTTMGIVAGLLVQNTLKYLLRFGQVSYYLGYNAMSNFFPTDVLRPNADCGNRQCLARQRDHGSSWQPEVWRPAYERDDDDSAVVHDDNSWGIECEGDDGGSSGSGSGAAAATTTDTAAVATAAAVAPPTPPAAAPGSAGATASTAAAVPAAAAAASAVPAGHGSSFVPAAGLGFLHEVGDRAPVAEADVVNTGGKSLEELMAQMKGLTARKQP